MARALLVVPPFIKYTAGPLLGPSLLQSAARLGGHECTVLDLNAQFIRSRLEREIRRGVFVGDHDKPLDPAGESILCGIERTFLFENILPGLGLGQDDDAFRKVQFAFLTHEQVYSAATYLASSPFGAWAEELMANAALAPQLVGVSLLHAGQVVPAVAASILARRLWPDTLIVWGGPHVSGLGRAVQEDIHRRSFAADLFVAGHAEKTLLGLLDELTNSDTRKRCVSTGYMQGRRSAPMVPLFENLGLYDDPSTLPAQSTLGCAYGRCAFCTYPAIEPTPTKLPLLIAVDSVVQKAHSIGASVAIKDSLATPLRLQEIAACVAGRVRWSACTKLSNKLDLRSLHALNSRGLATLEVGLESLLEDTQRRVAKVQPPSLYKAFLSNVAKVQSLSLVVNYMTGFPWENPESAEEKKEEARAILDHHLGCRGQFEHNKFELERLSPMAKAPARFHIDDRSLRYWPWASVVDFRVR